MKIFIRDLKEEMQDVVIEEILKNPNTSREVKAAISSEEDVCLFDTDDSHEIECL